MKKPSSQIRQIRISFDRLATSLLRSNWEQVHSQVVQKTCTLPTTVGQSWTSKLWWMFTFYSLGDKFTVLCFIFQICSAQLGICLIIWGLLKAINVNIFKKKLIVLLYSIHGKWSSCNDFCSNTDTWKSCHNPALSQSVMKPVKFCIMHHR